MDQPAPISTAPVGQDPPQELLSLSLARAYIDSLRERLGALGSRELADALERLDQVCREFPELMLDRARGELLEGIVSAAKRMPDQAAIPLLLRCAALDPSSSACVTALLAEIIKSDSWPAPSQVLHLLRGSRGFRWEAIEPILCLLRQAGRADIIVQILREVLDGMELTKDEDASDLGGILTSLTSDSHPGIGGRVLVEAARSARRRLHRPPLGRNAERRGEALLAMAERFAAPPPSRPDPHPDGAWPIGRMSFDEFLLQWPCEVELPTGLDDAAFIGEAYRAILLRRPGIAERDQYLRLLRDGVVSKIWIIEDLLGSEELQSLGRRLRVVWGGHVISEPTVSGQDDTPAVTWRWGPSG